MSHGENTKQSRQRMLVVFAAAVSVAAWFLVWLFSLGQPASAQSARANEQTLSSIDNFSNISNAISVTSSPTPTPECSPSWSVVDSPSPSGTNYLFDVAAFSANDVWAVGYTWSGGLNGRYRTLTIHWDGILWSQVTSPSPGNNWDILSGVDALSPDDVWTVGYTHSTGYGWFTLIEHWNGTQWSVVPSPNAGISTNGLRGVSAFSANDVWAVGYYVANIGGYGYRRTLIEHWNGIQWSIVSSPTVGGDNNELWNVAAIAPNDVWAAGYYNGQGLHALVQHWDGVQWSVAFFPNPPGASDSELWWVSGTSSSDVWVVGNFAGNQPGNGGTLVGHWDGAQWSVVPSPNFGPEGNNLRDVSAVSPNNVWAVGWYCCEPNRLSTIAMHWDGAQWTLTSSPSPLVNNYLYGVAAISESDVWAVGEYDSCGGCPWMTLVEHYTTPDTCLTPTPTPTPSPTNTSIPTTTPTSTQISTPTYTQTPTTPPILVGHVNWEARPPQPDQLQTLPVTLTLQLGSTQTTYLTQTDPYGFFTVTLTGLPNGAYSWYADDITSTLHSPNYLANSGAVNLTGVQTTNVEAGMMRVGDANNDNRVNVVDFNILKVTFGLGCENPMYDNRADFTGDCRVNTTDFVPLKRNYGQSGAP